MSLKNEYPTLQPGRQHVITYLLIIAIFMISLLFLFCTEVDENNSIIRLLYIFPILSVLMIGYVFAYRGKPYLAGRILLAIFIVCSLLGFAFYAFLISLGHAFTH